MKNFEVVTIFNKQNTFEEMLETRTHFDFLPGEERIIEGKVSENDKDYFAEGYNRIYIDENGEYFEALILYNKKGQIYRKVFLKQGEDNK